MGKLFVMPSPVAILAGETSEPTPQNIVDIDFKIWLAAPRERTQHYFPTFSAISRALQLTLRRWVREGLDTHPEIFERKPAAYALLMFECTPPYRGRTTNLFTYDIQQHAVFERVARAATHKLRKEVERLDHNVRRGGGPGLISIRPQRIYDFVGRNHAHIFRMFRCETALMDELLLFTQINIAQVGFDQALVDLKSALRKHLRRFTDEFDFSERSEELLKILTDTLVTRLDELKVMPIAA